MRVLLIFVFLFTFIANGYSLYSVYPITNGKVFVNGSKVSKQIFIDQNNSIFQISNFANWENIGRIFVSPDKKHLIVYHRADKDKFYRITLYDLVKKIELANTAPGMACRDLKWLTDKILFVSGTTGSGSIVFVYNYNLNKLFNICCGRLYIDTKNAICLRYPVYSAEDGIFIVYDLNTGSEIGKFDFKKETNENYICNSVLFVGDSTYQFSLLTLNTNKNFTVKKRFISK